MEETIIKFKYNNKEYIITRTEQNYFKFYSREGKNLNKSFNEDETDLLKHVLDSIRIRPEYSIYLRKRKVNNREYDIFYDRKTNLHWWKPAGDFQDKEEDHIFLNYLYNNCKKVLHEEGNKDNNNENIRIKEPNKFMTIISKYRDKIIAAEIIACISLAAITTKKVYSDWKEMESQLEQLQMAEDELEKADEYRQEIRNGQEYDFKDIENAIDSNETLDKEEKEILKKLKFVFDEDHEHMNVDLVKSRLATVTIKYSPESNGDIVADYNWLENAITIYNSNNIEDADFRALIHEIGHMNEIPSSENYHKELATEIWTREVMKKLIDDRLIEAKSEYNDSNDILTEYGVGYNIDIKLYYCLLELLTPEDRKNVLYQVDMNLLAGRLAEIDDDLNAGRSKRRAYNLIDDINELQYYNDKYFRQSVYDQINYYYELSHGRKIDEDLSNVIAFYDEYEDNKEWGSSEQIMDYSQYGMIMENALATSIWGKQRDEEIGEYLIAGNSVPKNIFYEDSEPARFYYKDKNGETKSIEITLELSDRYYDEYISMLESARKSDEEQRKKCKEERAKYEMKKSLESHQGNDETIDER